MYKKEKTKYRQIRRLIKILLKKLPQKPEQLLND